MSLKRFKEIESFGEIILNIISKNSTQDITIDSITEFIISIGGSVSYDKSIGIFSEILKTSEDTFIIKINSEIRIENIPLELLRQIGHLFFHMGFIIDKDHWNKSVLFNIRTCLAYSEAKYEATFFAGIILMPRNSFRRTCEKYLDNNLYSCDKIAEYFNLSLEIVLARGRWLGVFERIH